MNVGKRFPFELESFTRSLKIDIGLPEADDLGERQEYIVWSYPGLVKNENIVVQTDAIVCLRRFKCGFTYEEVR